jgi:hypothetical protein
MDRIRTSAFRWTWLPVLLLAASAAIASHQKTVNGLIVNIGVVPVGQATEFPPESASHGKKHPSGAKHLVVTLSDAKTGKHIQDAQVSAEIRDPKGTVHRKQLIPNETAGRPDYSEVFVLGWAGSYRIRIQVERAGAKPVRADFVWTNVVP